MASSVRLPALTVWAKSASCASTCLPQARICAGSRMAAPQRLISSAACCFTNQKTPLSCCARSRIREYFLCAACQVWLFREHFSASIASTTISAQRASLRSATSMVYVSVQFQSSLAICATVHQFQGFEKDVIMQFSTVNPICLFTKRICSRQTKAFTLQAPA